MKLLTSKAIQGYRDYTKRTIAYAKYKVGSTYHKTKIESVDVTEEGIVEVRFKIEAATTGAATVTEEETISGVKITHTSMKKVFPVHGKARKRNHIQANQYVALPDPDQPHGITTGCQMALLI